MKCKKCQIELGVEPSLEGPFREILEAVIQELCSPCYRNLAYKKSARRIDASVQNKLEDKGRVK